MMTTVVMSNMAYAVISKSNAKNDTIVRGCMAKETTFSTVRYSYPVSFITRRTLPEKSGTATRNVNSLNVISNFANAHRLRFTSLPSCLTFPMNLRPHYSHFVSRP